MESNWITAMDERGETPVSRALKCGHLAVGDLVLSRDVAARNYKDEQLTPLHWAAQQGEARLLLQYLERGENIEARDLQGETPLHKGAREGHLDVVETLVAHGAEINARDNYGLTPLHWVALAGSEGAAAFLLDSGADVNTRDYFMGGMTPLGLAKLMGYNDLAQLLSRHGGVA